jgi:hypothetical protein
MFIKKDTLIYRVKQENLIRLATYLKIETKDRDIGDIINDVYLKINWV